VKEKIIQPIREDKSDYDRLEDQIKELFRKELYLPLMEQIEKETPSKKLQNSMSMLLESIRNGRVRFYRGKFTGKFNASISKELRKIGAKWDRSEKNYKLPMSKLPPDIRNAISISESRFERSVSALKRKLSKMLPEKIADKLDASKIFDDSIYKTDKNIQETLRGITVSPTLTDEGRAKLAREYNNNMKRYIQDWSEKEIKKIRKDVEKAAMQGTRYENLVEMIQSRYDVGLNKAKFLARQETGLMMSKFRETRYRDAGSTGYYWKNVVGSPNHPVRPMHKALDGKFIRWDNPPITNPKGDRNHAGEDYNCRCFPMPVVRFDQ
jgi:SPP1 gp7 family putative phage head morphogenesis protein